MVFENKIADKQISQLNSPFLKKALGSTAAAEMDLQFLLDELKRDEHFDGASHHHFQERLKKNIDSLIEIDSDRFAPLNSLEIEKDHDDALINLCLECARQLARREREKESLPPPSSLAASRRNLMRKISDNNPGVAVCDLLDQADRNHLNQVKECEILIREVEKGLVILNEIVAEFTTRIDLENKGKIDLVALQPQIDKLHKFWDEAIQKHPDLLSHQDCPIPKGLKLNQIEANDLIKYQEKCRNLIMRLQERSKLTTLELQTVINLYELIVKITTSMADEVKKLGQHIQNNISKL